jgi:hypothetical protein
VVASDDIIMGYEVARASTSNCSRRNSANANVLHDEITIIDHAFTHPWTVTRSYRRLSNPTWIEDVCAENNNYVFIGQDSYFLSPDGYLMPTRKDQPPPNLRNFEGAEK